MADHKITDFVDQSAIDGLNRLKSEMLSVKDAYVQVAHELAKGLKTPVDGMDQLEKLIKKLAELQGQAAAATQRHTAALDEQSRIVANTTNTISRQLMEQEKLNEKTRTAYARQKDVKDILTQAVSSYSDMTKRLAEISVAQDNLNERKRHEKKLYEEGKITQDQYTSSLQDIIKRQQALAAEKAQLQSYTQSEAKENANASSSYNAMSQELLRLKKAYRELDEEGRNGEIGQNMLAEIKELGAHLKDMDASMGDFQRNVGDYAIACSNGVVVTDDLNRVLGLQAGTIAGCVEQNKALEDAKTKLNTADADYASTLDAINAKIAENNQRISDVSAVMRKSATSISEAQAQNKLLSEALKLVDVTSSGASEKIRAINAKIAENNKLIQDNSAQQQSIKKDLKEVVMEIANLTVQYRGMSEEEKASAKGKELAKHINELTEKAGELKDAIADTNRAITNAASDTRVFDQISSGVQLVIDGFGLATGAAEMLGISEGDLVEIQTKLQAAFVASNAVSKIQTQLQKESAVMQGVYALKTKAAAVAENIKTAAVGKGVVATKAASIAQAMFNKIAAANPYVLLAMALITVVGALVAFAGKSGEAEKAQERLNAQIKNTKRELDSLKSAADYNIALAEAAGESEQAIHRMRLEAAKAANDLAYMNKQKVLDDPKHTEEQYEEAKRLEEETYARYDAIVKEGNVARKKAERLEREERERAAKDAAQAAARERQRMIDSAKSAEEIELATLKFREKTLKAQLDAAEEFSDEWLRISKEISTTSEAVKVFELKSQFEKEIADVKQSYEAGKISLEQFESACESIQIDYHDRAAALAQKAVNDQKAAEDEVAAYKEQKRQDELDALEEAKQKKLESIEEEYGVKAAIADNSYNKRMADLKAKYVEDLKLAGNNEKKRQEITQKYEDDSARLSEAYAQQKAQASIDMIEEMLQAEDLSTDERERLDRDLAAAKIALEQSVTDATEAELKRQADAEKRTMEERKAQIRQWLQVASDSLNAFNGLASAIFDAQVQRIEEQLETVKNAGDAEQDHIAELVERGAITQEEGEARKRAAEAKTAQKTEELEKKKQAIKHKQAMWDKANSLAQAAIATALAITNVYPNLLLASIIGALGAVQIATILATPIPQYAKGTKDHPGGLAIVGDGGRAEVVSFGGQMYITPDTPTLIDMPRGAEVFPDADKIIGSLDLAVNGKTSDMPKVVVNNDYSGLQREVVGIGNLIKQQNRSQRRIAYYSDYEFFKASRGL